MLNAEQLHLTAELYRRASGWITAPADTPALVDPAKVAAAEMGVALRISRRSAMDRLGLAMQAVHKLPDTLAALQRGDLSLAKVRIIADATGDLSEENASQVEARVLPRASWQTPAGLGASLARAVLAVDPDAALRRRAEAVRERTVRFLPGPDGMASLWARLSAEDALGCYRELCELADIAVTPGPREGAATDDGSADERTPDDRSADARRADTLVDLIMGAATCLGVNETAAGPPTADPRLPDAGPPTAAGSPPVDAGAPATAHTPPAADACPDQPCAASSTEPESRPSFTDVPRHPDISADASADEAHAEAETDAEVETETETVESTIPAALRRSAPLRPRHGRGPVRLDVTVAWTTLAGLDDEPAHLGGYGPIDAEVARGLAADATWRRLLTDPASGTVLDVGTTRYSPPAAMAALVRARDRICRWYGCRQPVARCDLDHTDPHPHGPTATWNLAGLCRGHHRLKTHTRWRVEQDNDGILSWTSPTGQHVTTEPWPRDLHPPPAKPPEDRRAAE